MHFVINGDLTSEVLEEVRKKLKSENQQIEFIDGDVDRAAYFFPDFESILSIGAALAAILSFLHAVYINKKKSKLGIDKFPDRLNQIMQAFNVTDFEIMEIRNMAGIMEDPPRNARIVIRDLPTSSVYTVDITPDRIINVKRN